VEQWGEMGWAVKVGLSGRVREVGEASEYKHRTVYSCMINVSTTCLT